MWIQVRSMDGKTSTRIDGLSKLTKIEELRTKLVETFDAPVSRQRLFYRGKQLEDGYTLFDYDVGLNDIIQLLVKSVLSKDSSVSTETKNGYEGLSKKESNHDVLNKENEKEVGSSKKLEALPMQSNYFRVNDLVDVKDTDYGAWFEAKIIGIEKCTDFNEKCQNSDSNGKVMQNIANNMTEDIESPAESQNVDDSLMFRFLFQNCENEEPGLLPFNHIRPRARKILKLEEVNVGDMVMVNYNLEEPKERGYWYDCLITLNTMEELRGNLFVGTENTIVENCNIVFKDEVFAIEKLVPLSERKIEVQGPPGKDIIERKTKPQCAYCKDIESRKCKHCSCHVCGGKNDPGKQILCDECDLAYHIGCLDPPLAEVPNTDDWYCPLCKNDENEVVKPGEKLKGSRKKSKMASATSSSSRDWGKGMACVGRTKECTIVPPNHFGPIPGIEVGMMWKFRVQVSESGVHRPHVAGIHGRESEGAYSLVLSGGYEDDLDEGDEFKYTGSGGRDLSGNKRTAAQSSDQVLTKMNRALALNCATPLNRNGGEAKNWRKGKPVRVVRNCKGRKHSAYCPEEGNRYDGIYKVVKYWPQKGKSGYLVWRYLLRRDDPTPAPWTTKGAKRIQMLNFTMQYPDGYQESAKKPESKKSTKKPGSKKSVEKPRSKKSAEKPGSKKSAEKPGSKKSAKKSENRETSAKKSQNRSSKASKRSCNEAATSDSPCKKPKTAVYKLPLDVESLIMEDSLNKKVWEDCQQCIAEGMTAFLKQVENHFLCICCQEVVVEPITTECLHNICKPCLQRSFKAKVFCCPICRSDLGKNYSMKVNHSLNSILCKLFPGYNVGR